MTTCPRCNRLGIGASQWCPIHGDYADNVRPTGDAVSTIMNACGVCGESVGGGRASMALHLRRHRAYGTQMEMIR